VDKSPGPDQAHPPILWEAREEIAQALAEIFASSLSTPTGGWLMLFHCLRRVAKQARELQACEPDINGG